MSYQIHWKIDLKNLKREGWSALTYTKEEAEAIIKKRQVTEPDSTFDLIPIEDRG